MKLWKWIVAIAIGFILFVALATHLVVKKPSINIPLQISLGAGLALLVMSPILLPVILRWLANRDFFFTLVNEGEWKAVVRAGAFKKGLMAYKGYKEDEGGVIVEGQAEEENKFLKFLQRWFKFGGIRWLGIPTLDEIYKYTFRWVVVRKTKPSEKEDGYVSSDELPNKQFAVSFSKQLDYVYLRDANYLLILQDAETAGTWMPVTIYAVVTLRILNPYKALFRVDKWLDVTLFAIESALRSWTSRNTYDQVLQKKEVLEHQADDEFLQSLTEKGMKITDYVKDRYGAQVKRIQFLEVEMQKVFSEQATEQAAADRKAKTIATLRDAEYKRLRVITNAVRRGGDDGRLVFAGETIREASKGQATTMFLPFGTLTGLLRRMISAKGDD